MVRLGGHVLSSADPSATSAAKGETIADTVRVLENYADIIVIRHPWEGAARVAADFADVPVVNAGDGAHEHPTQTLCDLYTLRREKKRLKGLNVLLCGDLKNGRTVHSLVYALARFGAHIHVRSAPGFELPEHVTDRLKNKYGFELDTLESEDVDAVYRAPDEQPPLFLDFTIQQSRGIQPPIDVCYVTRLQLERLDNQSATHYPVVNSSFLRKKKFAKSSVLHPLPRVDELGYDIDADPRAMYFRQAAYGVPVRMAIISALLELDCCLPSDPSWKPYDYPEWTKDRYLECTGERCISNHDAEKRHLAPRFWIVNDDPVTLRCVYCEREVKPLLVANSESKHADDISQWKSVPAHSRVFLLDLNAAKERRFQFTPTPHVAVGAEH
jgi:aspartate carbamoyltransferase catalytic subunit